MLTPGYHDVPAGMVAMVVTHLEMHARPETPPLRLPGGVNLRRVVADTDWYRDIFRRVGTHWLWFSRLALSDVALSEIIAHPDVEIWTLTRDGRDEALMELDFRTDGACELAYFGLTDALIGTGSGRALMTHAAARAWSRDINLFHVHTCTLDSPQALDFYCRTGFTPVRRQVEIAEDPRLSGVLPADAAPHLPRITA